MGVVVDYHTWRVHGTEEMKKSRVVLRADFDRDALTRMPHTCNVNVYSDDPSVGKDRSHMCAEAP